MSLKFLPKGPINNIPALVQVTACFRYASGNGLLPVLGQDIILSNDELLSVGSFGTNFATHMHVRAHAHAHTHTHLIISLQCKRKDLTH